MKQARFLAAARLEYFAEVGYYAEAEPDLGRRFVEAVEEATARALAFPLAGSPSDSDTRRVLLKGFPFSLIYRVEHDDILIVALAHHGRKPGYWHSR
jgi:toxin ParE1/3/4